MRGLDELVVEDDAINLIRAWSTGSPTVVILDTSPATGAMVLEQLQITTRSPLGAVAFHTGGILIDHGWLRILGAGCESFPRSLPSWNRLREGPRCAAGLLVADDVLGGFFGLLGAQRTVHYLAPDTLQWEDLELGYGDWLRWAFTPATTEFYGDQRWEGWRDEVAGMATGGGLHMLPPLFTSGPPIGQRSRRHVPIEELWALHR